MQAIIMAGGEGQRLRPLTCTLPKPMVPLMGQPVLCHTLNLLKKYGFTRAALTLKYLPQSVKGYFQDEWQGISLDYFVEDTPLGTAGSVLNAGDLYKDKLIVLSGDALTDIDLGAAIAFHEQRRSPFTLVLKAVENPLEYGVVLTDGEGRVERFVEKPDWSRAYGDLANTGIYIIEPEVWRYFKKNRAFDFAKDMFPLLMEQSIPLYGYEAKGYWCDIGAPAQYLQAHRDVFDGKCALYSEAATIDGSMVERGVRAHSASKLMAPCYVGKNTVIEEGVALAPYTVIGADCVIKKGSSIKRSVVWDGCEIGPGAEIRGGIICSGADIAAGVNIYENSIVGQGSRLHSGAVLTGGARLWPHKQVMENTVVTGDCVWGNCRELFADDGRILADDATLTPECACRLGRAIGSKLGRVCVAVAHDGSPGGVITAKAVAAGLLSSGADVGDLGRCEKAVAAFGGRMLRAGCCVYINRGDKLEISLLGPQGLPLNTAELKGIRSAFDQASSFPARNDGYVVFGADVTQAYVCDLLSYADLEALGEKGGGLVFCAPDLMARLLCQAAACWGIDVKRAADESETKVYSRKHGVMGAVLDRELSLVWGDDVVTGVRLDMLTAYLDALAGERTVYADAFLPADFDGAVMELGAVIERVHTLELSKKLRRGSWTYARRYDPCQFVLRLAQELIVNERTLDKYTALLPRQWVRTKSVTTAWRDVGKVFRALAEERSGTKTELIEGVRISGEKGWVHVIPGENNLKIIAGAFSEEYAQALAELYAKRVKGLS